MNNLKWICMIVALLALIVSESLLARGGHSGGGHHIGGGGHRGFSGGGGFRHFSGGHHFRGGGRHGHHFGGRHRHHFGLSLGYFYPGFYGYRPYYRPYSYGYSPYYQSTAPTTPVVYIQREAIKSNPQSQDNYWHYCMNPEGYYPHVKQCTEGWLQVAPRPSAQ